MLLKLFHQTLANGQLFEYDIYKILTMDYNSAYKKAARLCGQQEHCCTDIKEKLVKWGSTPETVKNVITNLVNEKFIDENRYAGFYARDKFKLNGWGKQRIIWNLRQKKIKDDIIQTAIKTIDQDEYEKKLLKMLQEKSEKIKDKVLAEKKAVIVTFASSRGFEMNEIMKLLKKIKE